MSSYATAEQYVRRFGEVDDADLLDECLGDASAAIDAALERVGTDPQDLPADRLMRVCRSVANRLMPAGSDVPAGVTQLSYTSGSRNESVSFTPTYGTPKLLPSELSMLVAAVPRGRMLHPSCAVIGGSSWASTTERKGGGDVVW